MFWSTTIFRELQYPRQSHNYLNTVVCIPGACACVGVNKLSDLTTCMVQIQSKLQIF